MCKIKYGEIVATHDSLCADYKYIEGYYKENPKGSFILVYDKGTYRKAEFSIAFFEKNNVLNIAPTILAIPTINNWIHLAIVAHKIAQLLNCEKILFDIYAPKPAVKFLSKKYKVRENNLFSGKNKEIEAIFKESPLSKMLAENEINMYENINNLSFSSKIFIHAIFEYIIFPNKLDAARKMYDRYEKLKEKYSIRRILKRLIRN